MDELFTYYDMFASKGPEYLIIIGFFYSYSCILDIREYEHRAVKIGTRSK